MPDEPQRYVLSIAYKAGKDPRITKGADGGRDFLTAESLELAAWNYLAKGDPQVGIGHLDGTTGAATGATGGRTTPAGGATGTSSGMPVVTIDTSPATVPAAGTAENV